VKRQTLLQIVEANLNRLREGIRVVEESLRYSKDYQASFKKLRELRHKLGSLEDELRRKLHPELFLARDLSADIHAFRREAHKMRMPEKFHILTANLKRAQEASRNLEEYLKALELFRESSIFRKIRFEIYDFERVAGEEILKLEGALWRREKLISALYSFPLCAIISEENTTDSTRLKLAQSFYEAGGKLIQLRLKNQSALNLTSLIKSLKRSFPGILVIVNDRIDVALAGGADGAHLGIQDIPLKSARAISSELIIGVTTRSPKRAILNEKNGADYLGVGSIFPSPTKPSARVIGIEGLKKVRKAVRMPIIAIGGIGIGNFEKVLRAGADAVAVISALKEPASAEKLFRAVREFARKKK